MVHQRRQNRLALLKTLTILPPDFGPSGKDSFLPIESRKPLRCPIGFASCFPRSTSLNAIGLVHASSCKIGIDLNSLMEANSVGRPGSFLRASEFCLLSKGHTAIEDNQRYFSAPRGSRGYTPQDLEFEIRARRHVAVLDAVVHCQSSIFAVIVPMLVARDSVNDALRPLFCFF